MTGNSSGDRPELDRVRLAADPVTGPGGDWIVEILPETPSTNVVLADRARDGAPQGLVVTTEHQTAGRGRLDRAWQTPRRGALTFSVLLRPSQEHGRWPAERWPWLPLLAGVAARSALEEYGAGLKWPNDVLVGGRKLGGILVERVETPDGPAAVVGIGVNTGLRAEELPVPTATSLLLESGVQPDRTELLISLLRSLSGLYRDAGPEALREAYLAACVTVGQQVRVELPGGTVLEGLAEGIDEHGRLVVAHDGRSTVVGAGDVIHARLA